MRNRCGGRLNVTHAQMLMVLFDTQHDRTSPYFNSSSVTFASRKTFSRNPFLTASYTQIDHSVWYWHSYHQQTLPNGINPSSTRQMPQVNIAPCSLYRTNQQLHQRSVTTHRKHRRRPKKGLPHSSSSALRCLSLLRDQSRRSSHRSLTLN